MRPGGQVTVRASVGRGRGGGPRFFAASKASGVSAYHRYPVLPFLSANRGRKEPLDRENPAVPHLKTEEPPRTALASGSSRLSTFRSIGRTPRTRFFNSFLACRSASKIGLAASRRCGSGRADGARRRAPSRPPG